jgi:hypothetical protein
LHLRPSGIIQVYFVKKRRNRYGEDGESRRGSRRNATIATYNRYAHPMHAFDGALCLEPTHFLVLRCTSATRTCNRTDRFVAHEAFEEK